MKRVLHIQNGREDGPGLFARAMAEAGVEMVTVHPWDGGVLPTGMEGFDGLAIGGGGISVYATAENPFLFGEMRLVRAAAAEGKACFGMCLGAQVMAAAFGAVVRPNRAKEIGFPEVRLLGEAAGDPMLAGDPGAPLPFRPTQWHGDVFDLPEGAVRLAESDLAPNQAFRWGRAHYGFQFHLEIDAPLLEAMAWSDDGWLASGGVEPLVFVEEGWRHLPTLEAYALGAFRRWAALL
jgi:GMP synthase (glutamine-hydrolysing)